MPYPQFTPSANGSNTTNASTSVSGKRGEGKTPGLERGSSARFVVTLQTSVERIAPGSVERASFISGFVRDVSKALSVNQSKVRVLDVRAGSVVVDFAVISPPPSLDVLSTLRSAPPLAGAPVVSVAAVPWAKEEETGAGARPAAASAGGTTSDDGSHALVAVALGVAAALALIVVVALAFSRGKRPRQRQTVAPFDKMEEAQADA